MRLHGQPTIIALLTALVGFVAFRMAESDKDSIFHWRVPVDLLVYTRAGQEVMAGGALYDGNYVSQLPFTYPPFAGELFGYVSALPHGWLIGLWQFGSLAALIGVIVLVMRERGVAACPGLWLIIPLLALLATATAPVHQTYFFGQINIFLMLLVALDFLPRRRWPGIGTGLAAGIKLTPAFMGLVFLIQRRWGAAAGAFITFLATVGLGFALIPDAATFWSDSIFSSNRVGEHTNPGAQSLRSVLVRACGIDGGPVWIAAVLGTLVLTGLAIWVAVRRGNATAAMALAGIGACLVSPFSWNHHWVWVVPLALSAAIAVNRYLGKRLAGPVGAQVAGAATVATLVALMLPFLSSRVWEFGDQLYLSQFGPWAVALFTGSGLVLIAGYALSGLIPVSRAA